MVTCAEPKWCKSEAQIAIDLLAHLQGDTQTTYCDAHSRNEMANAGLAEMTRDVAHPPQDDVQADSDMHLIVL